jgi:transcriptional regulator with XRE-family HTH domain
MQLTKLRDWRQMSGMSQEELARRAGLSHAAISRIECGAGCTPATARKLAYALNLEIPDLVANPPQRAYATA